MKVVALFSVVAALGFVIYRGTQIAWSHTGGVFTEADVVILAMLLATVLIAGLLSR